MGIRCFIAIEIPEAVKQSLNEIIDSLKKSGADVKWVRAESIHLTLKFLGDTDEGLIPEIKDILMKKITSYQPFYIKIAGAGCFPSTHHPRVVWIGVESPAVLNNLQKDIDSGLQKFGYAAETREFTPHLTLGRVRSQKRRNELMNALNTYRTFTTSDIEVRGIKLMRSILKPSGAEYQALAIIPCGGEIHVKQG